MCLFVCLFWIRTRICPAGSTPEGGPTEKLPYHPGHSSPPGLVVVRNKEGCLGPVTVVWLSYIFSGKDGKISLHSSHQVVRV